jgi:RNA-directed DNA polymerase
VGFDFLGFNVRQYHVGKHRTRTYRGKSGFKTIIQPSKKAIKRHHEKLGQVIRQHRGAPQKALIAALNPIVRGWTQYFKTCVAKRTFSTMDYQMSRKLACWSRRRHPTKTIDWRFRRYWRWQKTRMSFSDGQNTLLCYVDTPIRRHVKVRGDKCPYDGDWVYWVQRLGKDPTKSTRTIRLLKRQNGQCSICGLYFTTEDLMETHHWDGNWQNNGTQTWVCSTPTVTTRSPANGTNDKAPHIEEPRDRETITRGFVVAVGQSPSPLTHSGADQANLGAKSKLVPLL